MPAFCRSNPILYRLNVFSVYVLIIVSVVMILSQVSLLSKFQVIERPRLKVEVREVYDVENATQLNDYEDGEEVKFDGDEMTTIADDVNDIVTSHYERGKFLRKLMTSKKFEKKEEANSLILLWTSEGDVHPPEVPKASICGGGCRTTTNKNLVHKSDAVIFTMKGMDTDALPATASRHSDQVYVWWSEESPWTSKNFYEKDLNAIPKNFFNWTMTYRRDSDVNAMMIPYLARNYVIRRIKKYEQLHPDKVREYPTMLPQADPGVSLPTSDREKWILKTQAKAILQRKTKMAAWVASNCGYTAGAALRMKIATSLFYKGLDIDAFGDCGNKSVPLDLSDFVGVISTYKFYLAFENTLHCRDYLTEKFWYNALFAGVVPIIWGPRYEDVEALAPPNSFIFYEHYETEEDLIDYLKHLDKNDDLYMEYFKWWWEVDGFYPIYMVNDLGEEMEHSPAMFDFETNAFCHLCSLLNSGVHKKHKKTVPSLNDWWYDGENEECLDEKHKADLEWPPTYDSDEEKEKESENRPQYEMF